jgi:YVTN family beta-propeller protein
MARPILRGVGKTSASGRQARGKGQAGVRISLTGEVSIEANGARLDETSFPGRQGRLVFAYLLAEEGRSVPRDELAQVLWGDAPPARWEKALSVLVSKLRALFESCGVDGQETLRSAFGCYQLVLPPGAWLDVAAAREAADRGEAALLADDLAGARAAAQEAAALARRGFLPGEDGDWIGEKRRELNEILVRSVTCQADASLAAGDTREAVRHAEELTVLEPFRERGYRRLMEAHAAAGDSAEALRVYERCRRLLADELGAYPSPETEAIYRALLRQPAPVDVAEPVGAPHPLDGHAAGGDEHRDASVPGGTGPTSGRVDEPRPQRPPGRRRRLTVIAAVSALAGAAAVGAFALTGRGEGPPTVAPNSLVRIGVASGEVEDVVPVGRDPGQVVMLGPYVFVASQEDKTLHRLDTRTGDVETSGAYATDGALVADGDFLWATSVSRAEVVRINAESMTATERGRLERNLLRAFVAVGGGSLWISQFPPAAVLRRDLRDGSLERRYDLASYDAPAEIAFLAGATWTAVGSTLLRIDAKTGERESVDTGPFAGDPKLGFGSIWVGSVERPAVWRLEPVTGRTIAIVPTGRVTFGLAPGAGSMWVTNYCDGTVSRIDPETNMVVDTIETGYRPKWLAVGPQHVWVGVSGTTYPELGCDGPVRG